MQTAICFTGTGRSIQHVHKNLKSHFIDAIGGRGQNLDVFVATPKIAEDIKQRIKRTLEPDMMFESPDIIHALDAFRFDSGARRRQEYLNMNRLRAHMGSILARLVDYDRVIHSRMDIKFFVPLEIDYFDLEAISIPDFHNFSCVQGKGLNDRFAVGNLENMLTYFQLYDYITKERDQGNPIHGESTLYRFLKARKIRVDHVPVRFTRVRPSGQEVDERLNKPRNLWLSIDK